MKKIIIWAILVASFVIGTTILMIYIAKGYRFVNNQFVATGILDIDSDPDNAKITIDGKEIGSTPKKITGLSEGNHELIVEKDNFISWKKSLYVTQGRIINLSIKLFPTKLNLEQITNSNIDRVFFSESGEAAIYTVTDNTFEQGIWRAKFSRAFLDFNTKEIDKIGGINLIPDNNIKSGKYHFDISKDNKSAILTLTDDTSSEYYLIEDLNLKYSSLPDSLNSKLGYNPKDIEWGDTSASILLIENSMIASYDLKSQTTELLQYKNDNSVILSDTNDKGLSITYKSVKYINDNSTDNLINSITFTSYNGKSIKTIQSTIKTPKSEKIEVDQIFITNSEKLGFIIGSKGNVYYIYPDTDFTAKIADNSKITSVSPSGKTILLKKTDNQLFAIQVDYNVVNDEIKFRESLFMNNPKNSVFKWYTYNDAIIEYNPDTKELNIYDWDGTNKNTLVKDITLGKSPEDFAIDNPQKEIILNLEESSKDNKTAANKNIYRIKL